MHLQCQLLVYLDKSNHLNGMKIDCSKFLEQMTDATIIKFPPLRYLLDIDVMNLLDILPEIGLFLLKEPFKFQQICNEILYACLKTIDNVYKENIASSQVGVIIRVKCVPRILLQPNSRMYGGLMLFEGLLLSISKPVSYAFHTVWSCPEECEGNEVIFHYIPKTPPKCYVCKSVLFENCGLKRCGEQVFATVKLKNDLLSKIFVVSDDWISKLKLGTRYAFYIVAVKKQLIVWSLEPLIILKAPITCRYPTDIRDLYDVCGGLAWKFIYCLASTIGVNICPLNCFINLKISLLLSLTSVKANTVTGSNIIHVIATGLDTRFVGEIMREAANLADRSICVGTHNTSIPTALIAGSSGICIMHLPLHIYNQKQTSLILSAIETGEIITDTGTAKIQCAVWAQGMDSKKTGLHNLTSVFGYVCRGDYGEYTDEIIEFMLQDAVEPPDSNKQERKALNDIKEYIDLICGIDVNLEYETEKLLREYFLAARKERPRAVSVASMLVLVATCLTAARLCQRNVTNVDDAVFAIWLHAAGCPEPRFAPDEYLDTPADVKKLDGLMHKFKVWLDQFISR